MATIVSGQTQAIPDWRYAHEVQPNALAEMLGIGPRGLRWRQIVVVAVTAWLAGNAEVFWGYGWITDRPWQSLFPVLFVFSAVTAAHTFGNGPAVTQCTAILYSLLAAAYASAIAGKTSLPTMRQLVALAAWAALMMLALQFSLSRRSRWVTMACAVFLADRGAAYLNAGLYSGEWSAGVLIETFSNPFSAAIAATSAIIWSIGFRIAESRYGHR